MRRLLVPVTVLLLAGASLAAVALTPTALVRWDQVTTDINGGPTIIAQYEAALFRDGGQVKSLLLDANSYTGTQLAKLVEGAADGSYQLRVRAQSKFGLWSEWSLPLEGVISTMAPAAPAGVRVK